MAQGIQYLKKTVDTEFEKHTYTTTLAAVGGGSISATPTGTPTITLKKIGNWVHGHITDADDYTIAGVVTRINVSGFTENGITLTALPAHLRPTGSGVVQLIRIREAAAYNAAAGFIFIDVDGSFSIFNDLVSTGAWAVGVNDGWDGTSFIYSTV